MLKAQRAICAVMAALLCVMAVSQATAKTYKHRHPIVRTDGNGNIVGARPAGCPHAFCGCEASRYLFGRIVPSLNLAANWIRQFPKAYPAPGMAAARNHHVFVLISHVAGNDWL